MKENTEGLKLACIYSWNCPTAKKLNVSKKLCDFPKLKTPTSKTVEFVKKILRILNPYKDYCKIAKILKIESVFDYRVVAAYWRYGRKNGKPIQWHDYSILSQVKHVPIKSLDIWHLNETCVLWGQIEEEINDIFLVKYNSVIRQNDLLILSPQKQIKRVAKAFTEEAKIGDCISFHFSTGAEILNPKESKNLTVATEETLRLFNAKTI